jgi:16S rRNA pseudouridine516 synthase
MAVVGEEAWVRLDKFLVQAAGLSRSMAQKAVRGGRVTVDGEVLKDPAHRLGNRPSVCLDGMLQALVGPRYLMLHKPPGYVCATQDPLHPTVLDLLPAGLRPGLHIAGRLDRDATGLVLLTDDGAWSHRVTSPRHHCAKRYRVRLAEPVTEQDVSRLRAGVQLRGEAKPTRPAQVVLLGEQELLLTIEEGRYHQVKRMFGALGNRVEALHRDRVGVVALDAAELPQGEFRDLSPAEVAALG